MDLLRVLLRDVHRLTVFVDEWSLRPNDDALPVIRQSLRTAAVGEGDTLPTLLCMVWLLDVTVEHQGLASFHLQARI